MESVAQEAKKNKRYIPHEVTTKLNSVKLYQQTKDIGFVCRRYHISKASLMRWNKQYDGTRESLTPKSHRPLTPHPNAHTEEELKWIRDYHRRNPNISICELYGKLREDKAYKRPDSFGYQSLPPKWNTEPNIKSLFCHTTKEAFAIRYFCPDRSAINSSMIFFFTCCITTIWESSPPYSGR